MLVGTVAALASGMSQVVMSIIFGRMVDAFGGATRDTILPRVDKVPFCFCMNLVRRLLVAVSGDPRRR
uniref:Uncharacterized protein n=1 Tax=Aegilops tauschii subsp. strangulata TaxID=200361 RepID=A0A452ZR61_AEGTS